MFICTQVKVFPAVCQAFDQGELYITREKRLLKGRRACEGRCPVRFEEVSEPIGRPRGRDLLALPGSTKLDGLRPQPPARA